MECVNIDAKTLKQKNTLLWKLVSEMEEKNMILKEHITLLKENYDTLKENNRLLNQKIINSHKSNKREQGQTRSEKQIFDTCADISKNINQVKTQSLTYGQASTLLNKTVGVTTLNKKSNIQRNLSNNQKQ